MFQHYYVKLLYRQQNYVTEGKNDFQQSTPAALTKRCRLHQEAYSR